MSYYGTFFGIRRRRIKANITGALMIQLDDLEKLEEKSRAQEDDLRITKRAIELLRELSGKAAPLTEPNNNSVGLFQNANEDERFYPLKGKAIARVYFALESIGRFAHKSEIEEIMAKNEPSIKSSLISNYLSAGYRKGQLSRVNFEGSNLLYFYGKPKWIQPDATGAKNYANSQYAAGGEHLAGVNTDTIKFK